MFGPILPNDLLNIVNDYAEPSINNTCRDIDIVIVQQLLNCWGNQSHRYFDALCEACRTNDFDLLVWLYHIDQLKNILPMMRTENFDHYTYPLRLACTVGNKKIITWLTEFFGYTPNDVRCMDDFCIIALCYNGHNDTAKWFAQKYKIKKLRGFDYVYKYYGVDTTITGNRPSKILDKSTTCRPIDAVNTAKLFVRWNKTDGSVWKMMRTDWCRVYDHIQNCGCENKAFVVCRCGVKICFFLRDYHIKHRGCCYACDRWVRPNVYKFLVEQLPDDCAQLVVELVGE